MNLNEIINELENYALNTQELKTSAEALQASVIFLFEQIQGRSKWSKEELLQLRESSQVNKALTMLEAALRSSERVNS